MKETRGAEEEFETEASAGLRHHEPAGRKATMEHTPADTALLVSRTEFEVLR